MALRYLIAVLILVTVVACSAPGAGDRPPGAAETAHQDGVPVPRATGGPATAPPASSRPQEASSHPTAEQVVARLEAEIPTARLSVVYTAENDPNELLGTPNAYVSKDAFIDTRIDPAQAKDTEIGSIELGGSVEVFLDEADARARKQYIDQTIAELPIDVSEYSYVRGPVLLRLSRRLTPEQAAEYEAALDAL